MTKEIPQCFEVYEGLLPRTTPIYEALCAPTVALPEEIFHARAESLASAVDLMRSLGRLKAAVEREVSR